MTRRTALFALAIAAFGAAFGLARPGLCLDPLPVVEQGPGFRTWMIESHRPLLKLEDALAGLRSPDRMTYEATLDSLGLQKRLEGREISWPELEQPIAAETHFLSFERRKLAVISAPIRGRVKWLAVVLRQEGNGEAYWRAIQAFEFDTDPVDGYAQEFPDINGEDIDFWLVHHMDKDDAYGRARVSSIFRYDEHRLRLVYHEVSDSYRPAKFQGQALKLEQTLVFKGDQKILRKLSLKTYPFMKREEFDHYDGVRPAEAKPTKVTEVQEAFAWNPADFNFYQDDQELEKLVTAKSPLIRRDAARRLGEHMKTTHPQLEEALLKDKDAYVRIQCALALGAIGDPKALPGVEKALLNYNEPDEVRDALQQTEAKLKAIEAAQPTPEATPVAKKKHKKKAPSTAAGAVAPVTGPKVTEKQ
jgi:hypothetical protein